MPLVLLTESPRPGQAHPVVTPEDIAAVEAILKENRHVTVNETAAHLDMRHGSAHHIVHDVLQFHKAFSKLRDKKILKFSFRFTLVFVVSFIIQHTLLHSTVLFYWYNVLENGLLVITCVVSSSFWPLNSEWLDEPTVGIGSL